MTDVPAEEENVPSPEEETEMTGKTDDEGKKKKKKKKDKKSNKGRNKPMEPKGKRTSLSISHRISEIATRRNDEAIEIADAWTTTHQHDSVYEFQNISYVVGKKKKEKQILKNISGRIGDGSMLAIMGPSGAGKSEFFEDTGWRF